MQPSITFLTKVLHQANTISDYELYIAALEWNLMEPIIINNLNELKSKSSWSGKFNPYDHQINNLINFCRRLPVTLIADDVGLGKTISAGLIVSELISRGKISKILIVSPKIILPQWREELKTKFDICAKIAIGSEITNIAKESGQQVILTTYSSSRIHFEDIKEIGFDMLILDEAHKLRNLYGVQHAPKIAKIFHTAFSDRVFKYVLMLTATPIHNRLWDIYSLIELLTTARGVDNPFGHENKFSNDYILDDRHKARKLKPEKQDKFRSIVYGYMSRIRRNQVSLSFPDRIVKLIKVDRMPNELVLFDLLSEELMQLNALSQISLLQAYVSSPQALAKQLENMAENGVVKNELAIKVRSYVDEHQVCAKLEGLNSLIKDLIANKPKDWRIVIFTCRRETQSLIQSYLQKNGHVCGVINGDSAERNLNVLNQFNEASLKIHIIISTEAGSEGLNLQVANVLVNYDLPWNPMIVEQRIGRLQRLSSNHANVTVLNIILKDTFEEFIVGRLMEKLQLACDAVGDIESLLQPLGIDRTEEDCTFEKKIKDLVLASLSGKNVTQALIREENSIRKAREEFEKNKEMLNGLLSDSQEYFYQGPRFPKLQQHVYSMDASSFVKKSLAHLNKENSVEINNGRNDSPNPDLSTYTTETNKFNKLVSQITEKGLHLVQDLDFEFNNTTEKLCQHWVEEFGGIYRSISHIDVKRKYIGKALVRVRVTVAYDSYEKLIYVACNESNSDNSLEIADIAPLSSTISNLNELRLSKSYLISESLTDESVSEFCRFYSERLDEELKNINNNDDRKVKLIDDLTPRVHVILVGLQGSLKRWANVEVHYSLGKFENYSSHISLVCSENVVVEQPVFSTCGISTRLVPINCLVKCEISGKQVIKDLLFKSEISCRYSLPEYCVTCAVTGKKIISDEAIKSSITGKYVSLTNVKTSPISEKSAEPEFFGKCDFTSVEVLHNELAISQISGKNYRIDEQAVSTVSGKIGHKSEFTTCSITNQSILLSEGEKSEISGKIVMPGLLEKCSVSGRKALPSEVEKSSISGKIALKRYFVTSSISGSSLLEQEAIRSANGKFCSSDEAKICFWSGIYCHIDDLRVCKLTRLNMHVKYINHRGMSDILCNLLDGVNTQTDKFELWDSIVSHIDGLPDLKNSKIVNAVSSPDGKKLALRVITRKWFGMSIRYRGLFFSLADNVRVGKIVTVKL